LFGINGFFCVSVTMQILISLLYVDKTQQIRKKKKNGLKAFEKMEKNLNEKKEIIVKAIFRSKI
jgi:hypothetical protein